MKKKERESGKDREPACSPAYELPLLSSRHWHMLFFPPESPSPQILCVLTSALSAEAASAPLQAPGAPWRLGECAPASPPPGALCFRYSSS